MSDRISAAQLAEIEQSTRDGMTRARSRGGFDHAGAQMLSLIAEIRAAWGEAEAATRALRELLAIGTSDEPGLVRDRAIALLGDDDESTA